MKIKYREPKRLNNRNQILLDPSTKLVRLVYRLITLQRKIEECAILIKREKVTEEWIKNKLNDRTICNKFIDWEEGLMKYHDVCIRTVTSINKMNCDEF